MTDALAACVAGRDGACRFHAVVRPHQSLSDSAFEAWVLVFLTLGLGASIVANMLDLLPIGLFCGADSLLIAALFVAWRASQDRHEEIIVAPASLLVRRYRKGVLREQRRFGLEGLEIVLRDDPDYGCLWIGIARHGVHYGIARDLGPLERAEFVRALASALGPTVRTRRIAAAGLAG